MPCLTSAPIGFAPWTTATADEALYTMISPNATRPRVSRSSRWYSMPGARSARAARRASARAWTTSKSRIAASPSARGRRAASAGAVLARIGRLAGQPRELVAAVDVVAELVEAGAGRREQDDVPRDRGLGRVGDGPRERAAAPEGRAHRGERRADGVGCLADQVDPRDRPRGDGGGQPAELRAL